MSTNNNNNTTSVTSKYPEVEAKREDVQEKNEHANGDNDEDILTEIPTFNFTLLLCGLLIGIGLGYIVWEFVKKDLVLWIGAGIGLLVARLLEITRFPQNVVKIWTPKSSVELTQIPKWKDEIGSQCDFFVQSDMHDIYNRYMGSTAVFHYPKTHAVAVQERRVRRRVWTDATLFMSSPVGGAISFIVGLIATAAAYLRKNSADSISLFVVSFFVLFPVIILVGCLIEVELRKKRFFARDIAIETVTNIPLHTIGKVKRFTFAQDFWKLLFIHPMGNQGWGVAKLGLKFIFGPVMVFYKIAVFVVMLTQFNGAFAVFVWECIATILLYQAHVHKDSSFLEPTMAFMWLAFVVNLFEIWYCWPANGRGDNVSVLGTHAIHKLTLDSDKRIPKQKVNTLLKGFVVSLILIGLSAIIISSICDQVLEDITVYNFDKSWENNYKENKNFIMCDAKTTNNTRRLGSDFDAATSVKTAIKSKYTSDYAALCTKKTYGSMAACVALASLDWFLLLILAVYWHVNDKAQENFDYDNSQIVWYDTTSVCIHYVSSTMTWIGRIIGTGKKNSFLFYMKPNDAEAVEKFITNVAPWYAHLQPNQPNAASLMPNKNFNLTKPAPGA